MNRRNFLQSGAALSAAQAFAAGENKRVGLIGSGWYGKADLLRLIQVSPVEVVSLCDVDKTMVADAADLVATRQKSKKKPRTFHDYREMLKQKDLDIVLIAPPDHWHALQTIAAVKAGAHVFVEKPTGHTVNESRAMLRAAREGGRVVQVGLHRRIGPHHVSGMKFLKSGAVGEVGMVRIFAHGGGGKERPAANRQPPEGMDWNLWCGPAPLRPFNQ